jgi:hypothetical protein
MGDDGIYIARVMDDKLYAWRPSVHDVECLAANRGKEWILDGYFGTLYRLLLAGFCMMICTSSVGDDVFQPTGRYATIRNPRIVQWYLVSEPWCQHCPAAKTRFLAKGWPAENVLTIAEASRRFGVTVASIPFEFPEPTKQSKPSQEGTIAENPQVRYIQRVQYRRGGWFRRR